MNINTWTQGIWGRTGSPGTVRVTLAYRDTPTQGTWGRTGSPGTVKVTLAYRHTPTQGIWGRTGSPGIVPGLSELLWRTGILQHRVSGGGLVVLG